MNPITNLWDLQLTPPHFYFFSTSFVCSPIKIGSSEKQRACCCSTFIPDHSLHSLSNTLVLLIAISVLLFFLLDLKKIETRDIYNGPHPNRASRDGITNLWDLQLAPPHFYFFSTSFVCSPIKIGRSEKQRACCCSKFIPVHSLHSLFVFDNKK